MDKRKNTAQKKLTGICLAAMFAAVIFTATKLIQIPAPTGGFVHFGDCFILIAAWVLGPVYGFAAAGVGSAFVDMFGYAQYVPGTFFVKGLMAAVATVIVHALMKRKIKHRLYAFAAGGFAAELIMIGGYYLYEALLLGYGFAGAFAGVFGNIVQGAFGLTFGVILIQVFEKTKVLKNFNVFAL